MNEILSKDRPARAPLLLAFLAGVGLVQWLSVLPDPLILVAIVLSALLSAWRRHYALAGLLAGIAWALCLAHHHLADELPLALEQSELRVEGTVASVPESHAGDTRFLFDIKAVLAPNGASVPRRVRLTWYRPTVVLKAGERWRLALKLKRPHGMMNPGGLDYELWLFAHGIRATGYVRESASNQRIAVPLDPWGLQRWRQALSDALASVLHESRFAGILRALVFGDESAITPEQWDALRRTGTAHLVAISGSHIALIAAWCFAIGSRLAAAAAVSRWAPTNVGALVGLGGALFYAALADFAIPTRRALVMITVVMLGIVLKRPVRPFYLLLLAAFAVAAADPLAVLAAGFWLSFAAVAAILWVASHRLRVPSSPVAALWRVNWATALVLAPLLLLFFGQIPLLSPLANFVAVPLFAAALIPLCLLGTGMLAVHKPLGAGLFALAERLLDAAWPAMEWMARLPAAQWTQAQPPLWSIVLALLGAAMLLAPRGVPARWLGCLLLAPALTWQARTPPPGEAMLTLLDVGQGLAAVVRTQRHTLVFDTGTRFSDRFDIGSAVLWPFLMDEGITRVDTLVISHADIDHLGGAESLSRLMPIGLWYTSAPDQVPSVRPVPCHVGQEWWWDGVRFEVLSPLDRWGNDNDRSCVLRVTAGPHRALLTGDIEASAERRLVQAYGHELKSNVLVAPHHGSDSSSTAPFLDHVSPDHVLVSAGYRNRYGFPASSVLQRYQAVSARVWNTADQGAISIGLGVLSSRNQPVGYRSVYRRYWHWRP